HRDCCGISLNDFVLAKIEYVTKVEHPTSQHCAYADQSVSVFGVELKRSAIQTFRLGELWHRSGTKKKSGSRSEHEIHSTRIITSALGVMRLHSDQCCAQ